MVRLIDQAFTIRRGNGFQCEITGRLISPNEISECREYSARMTARIEAGLERSR